MVVPFLYRAGVNLLPEWDVEGTAGQLARNEMIRLVPSEIWALLTRSLEEWERQGVKQGFSNGR